MKKIAFYLLFSLNLGAIIYLWLSGTSYQLLTSGTQSGILIAFGRLFGLLGEFFILVQLILIGRITFIEQQFGHDRLNQLHRWIGYGMVLFFLGHPLLLTLGYSQISEVSFWSQFLNFLKNWEDVFKAFLAVLLFVGVILTSIVIVKKRLRYETWYFTHLLMYLGVALAFGHQTNTGDLSDGAPLYYWLVFNFVVFGFVLIFRWLRPIYRFYQHRFYIEKVLPETPGVFSIYLKGRELKRYKFYPGQFANLTFLQRGMWFTHPFSFSTAPNGEYLRFSIKASGDFTNKINSLKTGTKVIIDGPLGIFTPAVAITDKFLLIAGGIGITPIRALAEHFVREGKNIFLLYGMKTDQDITFKDELQKLQLKYHFMLSEVIVAPGGFGQGHINRETIKQQVPDFLERDIYLCGPTPMMTGILTELKSLGMPKKQIHYEKFNY
jgi:predicted ferric reductase